MCRIAEPMCRTGERVCRTGERSRTVLHLSCLITDPSTLLRDPMTMRLEATLPFQGSYDAGPVSAVEPSCIYLANHGPFDRLRDPMTQDR